MIDCDAEVAAHEFNEYLEKLEENGTTKDLSLLKDVCFQNVLHINRAEGCLEATHCKRSIA